MSKKRLQYSSDFKAKEALAALKGDETTSELAARFEVHPSMVSQWKRELLGISPSSLYYQHRDLLAEYLTLKRLIDEQHLLTPMYGSRWMTVHLNRLGHRVNPKRTRRLMRQMGFRWSTHGHGGHGPA